MSTRHGLRPILAGIDGSDAALRAVRWAAREAVRRRVPLRLLHGYEWPEGRHHIGEIRLGVSYREVLLRQAREWLSEAVKAAEAAAPELEVLTDLRFGHPVELLVHDSHTAQLVVLGSRGMGGFAGLLLGSVAVGVAAHATCPVVVVRGADAESLAYGPVVVGVDGSPNSEVALAFAYEAAAARGVELVAVHAWQDVIVESLLEAEPIEAEECRLLAQRLAGWAEKYPDVPVQRVVAQDSAPRALLHAAEGAQLVVVGSRGRGGFLGLLLGSTSQALIHHAPCPVVVIRSETA